MVVRVIPVITARCHRFWSLVLSASSGIAAPAAAGMVAAAALAAAPATLLGCSREPSSEVVAEPTPTVPTDVVFYTHVLYGGDDAYLVDGQWFRPA